VPRKPHSALAGKTVRWMASAVLAACGTAGAVAVGSSATEPALTAEQIVEKNEAARGGLEAWSKVQTMVWVGRIETSGGTTPPVPFVLQQKRPNKTRFELNAMGQRTVRVFDGKRGWKARPGPDGRPDVQPFSPQELRFAQGEVVIDGPLFGYPSRRVAVELDGTDLVDGRKAYRLIVRTASGQPHNVWIDAQTFLDLKYDRISYSASGVPKMVSVFCRDYKTVAGLRIPGTIETGVGSGRGTERMVIETVALNPPLDDRLFGRPGGAHHRATVTIDPEPLPGVATPQSRPPTTTPAEPGTAAPASVPR
jgi:hypothetical protein